MRFAAILIANRGEIAIRIARAAAGLGVRTVAVHSADDARSLHVRRADAAMLIPGSGPAAYLSIPEIVAAARAAGCDAVHPGYGFLSENAEFARACAAAGLTFIGPDAETLSLFGDKARARALAAACEVPIAGGTAAPTSLEQAHAFLRSLGPGGAAMVKAMSGGGGRGIRVVLRPEELDDAYARCQSEARAAFGNGAVYLERYIRQARHVEVQVAGDGTGAVIHLWERECTLQRRHQKLLEIAPSPGLDPALRGHMLDAALRLARHVRYAGLGTFEFLVDPAAPDPAQRIIFMEANPRLQVEHTVTEEVTGIDLVRLQIRLAAGATLAELGMTQDAVPPPAGHAVQLRINMETMTEAGETLFSGGTITAYEPPSGPGVRVDGFGYAGYATSPRYDSLLAKLIVHRRDGSYADTLAQAGRAVREFRIEGVQTNLPLLAALLRHPDVRQDAVDTGFVEAHAAELAAAARLLEPASFFEAPGSDPSAHSARADMVGPAGAAALVSPLAGIVVGMDVAPGDVVRPGQVAAVVEAMKMEVQVRATMAGRVIRHAAAPGDVVSLGQPLLFVEPAAGAPAEPPCAEAEDDETASRTDLAEVLARRGLLLDAARPAAVERRHRLGQRTARENVADLCDPGSFEEYGGLTLPMQRGRRPLETLIQQSPADGLVTGIGTVNGASVSPTHARCAVLAYDYTVFAGTQGFMAHRKTDRILEVAAKARLPVVLFSEGGGGRPGDTDYVGVSGLELRSFTCFGQLSGLVPLVGVNAGRCFAGNAALLGCCDVVIATRNSTIGMGGPAMIEGGGLGRFTPDEVGPAAVQASNGVIDIVVEDEAAAVAAAKSYLSYFQGPLPTWKCAGQEQLRRLVPANRRRAYEVRAILAAVADAGSLLELRSGFGLGIVTALARIEGRPVGVIANNPMHLGGAIDAPGADKAARFMQLCDAFDLPLLTFCDTPGFMVGPDAERTATVRHFARLFVTGTNLDTPIISVILRKAYGLGAQAMLGGNLHAPVLTLAWPTGEFGPMGLEGYVELAYRRELASIEDAEARETRFKQLVAGLYENGKALNAASFSELDDVIDPADTRRRISAALRSLPALPPRTGKKRPMIDTW